MSEVKEMQWMLAKAMAALNAKFRCTGAVLVQGGKKYAVVYGFFAIDLIRRKNQTFVRVVFVKDTSQDLQRIVVRTLQRFSMKYWLYPGDLSIFSISDQKLSLKITMNFHDLDAEFKPVSRICYLSAYNYNYYEIDDSLRPSKVNLQSSKLEGPK